MAYLLDANVFIQAKNLHYGLDFCPAFWEWLIEKNAEGRVYSIEKVGDELSAGGDELTAWAEQRGSSFFIKPGPFLTSALQRVSTWAMEQNYESSAVYTFLQVADYYLTAHGFAQNYTIVTHEIASTSVKRIKIPDVCLGLGVKCMSPYEMLRRERAKFVLGR